MRVTVELVKGAATACTSDGCLHASEAFGSFVKAPIFAVTIVYGPKGRAKFTLYACEDHLTGLSEHFAYAVDSATRALLGFTPAETHK